MKPCCWSVCRSISDYCCIPPQSVLPSLCDCECVTGGLSFWLAGFAIKNLEPLAASLQFWKVWLRFVLSYSLSTYKVPVMGFIHRLELGKRERGFRGLHSVIQPGWDLTLLHLDNTGSDAAVYFTRGLVFTVGSIFIVKHVSVSGVLLGEVFCWGHKLVLSSKGPTVEKKV